MLIFVEKSSIDRKSLIQENQRRLQEFKAPYNPYTGEGSPISRTLVVIPEYNMSVYLPDSMLKVEWVKIICERQSFTDSVEYIIQNHPEIGEKLSSADDPVSELFITFTYERFSHDFEYFAATTLNIQDKQTLEDIPFKLRRAQRRLLARLEKMRLAGKPIRVILLKARQWGGSTLIQMYMLWIQQIHKQNWHLAVCAQGDDAAKNINAMYSRAAQMYPKDVGTITLKAYERSPKNRICVETGGIIGIGSYLNPDQFRSYNYPMVHQSELGLWEDTMKRKAANVAQSLRNAVPNVPYSLIALESTAKGFGNFFHNEWIAATEGKSRYDAVFVPWWEIEIYQAEIIDYEAFVGTMSDYDWFLWELGATLEGINWYNLYKTGENYTDWQMFEEFPSTADEAFQSSGHKVFHPAYVQAVSKDCVAPMFIGDIYADKRVGENAFSNITFGKSASGNLWVWGMPDPKTRVKNRYAAFADIGGRTAKADWSVLRIIDRIWMIDGGDPEFILTWRGHIDIDLFAWKCAQICMAYAIPEIGEYPLLAVEVNSIKSKNAQTEGEHGLTVLDNISEYYPNLYVRNDFEKIGDGFIPKYGFHTNSKTKTLIIDSHVAASRERYLAETNQQEDIAYIERDRRAVNEMNWYEVKKDGSMGAVDGKNDDIEITTAGSLWLAISHMDKPFYVEEKPATPKRSGVRRESSF